MKKEALGTYDVMFHLGIYLMLVRDQNWAPITKGLTPGRNLLEALKTDFAILKELKLESLSMEYFKWAQYFEKNYTAGQKIIPADLGKFSQDVNRWLGMFKTELEKMKIEKTERKVEGKLKKLIKEIKTLEDKIDELQDEFASWRADISK